MEAKYLLILGIFVSAVIFSAFYHSGDGTLNIPPTPAIKGFTTKNATVYSMNYSTLFHLIGLHGFNITGNNLTKSIYFDAGQFKNFNPIVTPNATVHATQVNTTLNIKALNCIQIFGSELSKTIYINGTCTSSGGTVTSVSGVLPNTTSTGGSNPIIGLGTNAATLAQVQTFTAKKTFSNQALIDGLELNAVSKTNSYSLTSKDDLITVNATSGNYTLTLPTINSTNTGKIYTVKKIDTTKNIVELLPTSAKIDTFNNYNITKSMDSIQVQNDGSNWFTLIKPYYTNTMKILRGNSNSWYGSWENQGTPTTFVTANKTLYAVPFVLSHNIKLSQIQFEVTSAGMSNVSCRIGIYTDGGGYPLNLVTNSDVAILSGNSTGVLTNTFSSNIILQTGLYYLAQDCTTGTSSAQNPQVITQDVLSSTTTANNVVTATQSVGPFTVGSNSNRLISCAIDYLTIDSNHNHAISTVKIGSTSFTKSINKTTTSGSLLQSAEIWTLVAPSTGSTTVTITPAVPANGYWMVASCRSLYNVHQTTPTGATGTSTGTSSPTSVSITPTNTNAIIQETMMANVGSSSATSPTDTQEYAVLSGSGGISGAGQHKSSPTIGSSNSLGWTQSGLGASNTYDEVALEIRPSLGAASASNPTVRAIPTSSIPSILGMVSTMGATNGNTMYSATYSIGIAGSLPATFPTNATLQTTAVPEILVKSAS